MCLRHYINCIQVESHPVKKKMTVQQDGTAYTDYFETLSSHSKIREQSGILPWTGSICYPNVWNEKLK